MLRKDVRIGLAIGGGLVAVLIVILLITSGPTKNTEVTLVPDADTTAPAPPNGQPSGDAAAIDPFKDPAGTSEQPAKESAPATAPTDDRWQRALSTGKVESDTPPLLLTETPAPAQSRPQNEITTTPPTTSPSSVAAMPATASPSGAAAPTPASTAPRTHVIQTGESFSTIAQVVYGNSSYYPHLIRANPNIDPKKLRPGTTIVIPDAAQVVATASPDTKSSIDSKPAITLDDKREYRVQTGDSLYKIALKLYGKAERADAIYDLNKDAIGPNRSYLKVGMTLKLPEPPTSTTAAR